MLVAKLDYLQLIAVKGFLSFLAAQALDIGRGFWRLFSPDHGSASEDTDAGNAPAGSPSSRLPRDSNGGHVAIAQSLDQALRDGTWAKGTQEGLGDSGGTESGTSQRGIPVNVSSNGHPEGLGGAGPLGTRQEGGGEAGARLGACGTGGEGPQGAAAAGEKDKGPRGLVKSLSKDDLGDRVEDLVTKAGQKIVEGAKSLGIIPLRPSLAGGGLYMTLSNWGLVSPVCPC